MKIICENFRYKNMTTINVILLYATTVRNNAKSAVG